MSDVETAFSPRQCSVVHARKAALNMQASLVLLTCYLALVLSQTQHKSGNPTGEIGSPAFDEIVVESSLTVRGKSASRGSKSLSNVAPKTTTTTTTTTTTKQPEVTTSSTSAPQTTSEPSKRVKRVPRQRQRNPSFYYPGSSSSAAHASANAFNSQTPFGSFGASNTHSASQSQNFGPGGFQANAGQSGSQSYHFPNGNQIDVAFSNSFGIDNGKPSFSNSHAITVTGPNGEKRQYYG